MEYFVKIGKATDGGFYRAICCDCKFSPSVEEMARLAVELRKKASDLGFSISAGAETSYSDALLSPFLHLRIEEAVIVAEGGACYAKGLRVWFNVDWYEQAAVISKYISLQKT